MNKLYFAGIAIAVSVVVMISLWFSSQQPATIIPVDTHYTITYNGVSYYYNPVYINITTERRVQFDGVIFTYEDSTPITGDECNAKKINATYDDYKATEIRHFEIILNGNTYHIKTCWLPPYTEPFPDYPVQPPSHGGVRAFGYPSCPFVYLWADKEKTVGIAVHLTEGRWHMSSGDIYRLYCSDGIHYIVKAQSGS